MVGLEWTILPQVHLPARVVGDASQRPGRALAEADAHPGPPRKGRARYFPYWYTGISNTCIPLRHFFVPVFSTFSSNVCKTFLNFIF